MYNNINDGTKICKIHKRAKKKIIKPGCGWEGLLVATWLLTVHKD